MARTLPPYNPLESLDDIVTRNYTFEPPAKLKLDLEKYKTRAKKKYEDTKKQIREIIENSKSLKWFVFKW